MILIQNGEDVSKRQRNNLPNATLTWKKLVAEFKLTKPSDLIYFLEGVAGNLGDKRVHNWGDKQQTDIFWTGTIFLFGEKFFLYFKLKNSIFLIFHSIFLIFLYFELAPIKHLILFFICHKQHYHLNTVYSVA